MSDEEKVDQKYELTHEQVEILKWAIDTQMGELQVWRRNQDFIFNWVTTVFLAAIAGILALLREPTNWSDQVRSIAQWGTTGVVAVVTLGSLAFLWINRDNYERCARAISRITKALGFFDPGRYMVGTVYPKGWATWGYGWWRRRGPIARMVLVIILAATLISGIWLIE